MLEMAIKMDRTVIIVSAAVGSLGALSAILGFAAAGDSANGNPSAGLAICAALFLLVAHSTITAVAVVGYCKFRPVLSETKQIVVIVCGVVSWVGAVIASVMFLFGASWNSGIYAGAAVLTIVATVLGITCFIMLRQPADAAPATGGASAPNKPAGEQAPSAGIATGQPKFQPGGVAGVPNDILSSRYGSQGGNGAQAPNHQFSPPQGHELV